jgi:ubiquinone/menaquinone biosynthesis C-methylase UbiE
MPAKSFYNRTAANYDLRQRNPWTQAVREAELGLIKKHAKGKVLDIGCGTGFHLSWMEKNKGLWKDLAGCDASKKMLEEARKSLSSPLVECAAERLQFPDGSFDTALCLFMVLNVCDHRKALAEMKRVLKPGGTALLSVASVWDSDEHKPRKVVRIDKGRLVLRLFDRGLLKEIERLGFSVVGFDSLFRANRPRWGDWKSKVAEDLSQPVERGAVWLLALEKT